ncbi:MAG TPA: response regulator [Thermoanaerobaculia bacterium]|nr:response regulator [Thermoanaerobaculia bacterium]
MIVLRLSLLGDLQMHDSAGALVSLSARKSQALLAYLSVRPAQRVSRDKIAGLLWSSTGPEQARQSLRQLLSNLRKDLHAISPDETILIEEGDFLAVDPAVLWADVADFEALVANASEPALRQAVDLYRGDFLDGFSLTEERFDQWVLAERDRLHRLALRAHSHLVEALQKKGAVDEAIETAQRSLRIDALQEPMHRTLMRLYMQSGDLANALQQYETLARVLRRELRVDPDAETKALYQQVVQLRSRRVEPQGDAEGSRKKTILVVEDNILNRELTNAVLKSAGYEVRLANDGAEALMVIGREKVDLLLLDIDLPFIDGHKVLEALKEKGFDVPAIFVSGLPGEEPEVRAFEIGAVDFIRKPIRNSVLLARVARALQEA